MIEINNYNQGLKSSWIKKVNGLPKKQTESYTKYINPYMYPQNI